MAKLQKGVNDLKTWCLNAGDFGQKLLQEWTGECEDGKHYEIDGVSFGSGKRFKWKCSEGHEWISGINNRTAYKTGCNKCKSILCKENSRKAKLYKGENDLKIWCSNNAEFGRQLLNEWTGECEDGKHYEIDEVARATPKRVKWKCNEGHEWTVGIVNRTAYKTQCPYCSGNRVSDKNSLKNWCLNNGDFGQQLLQEWTGDCEGGRQYKIDKISFGSNKKFQWRCSEGHVWLAKVHDRSSQQQGCPYCSGKRVSGKNSLQRWCLSNTEFGQQLVHEWTGQCEDGKHYAITAISFGSAKQFKWKCDKGHEWIAGINSRTAYKTGCPYCSGSRVSNENSLKSWCLNNGDFGQQLLNEWTGICEDDNQYEISDISFGSQKKFKWTCTNGHVWFVGINSRTKSRTGCPYCSNKGTSYPEQVIYRSMLQLFPNTIHRGKYQGYEFDITIPEIKTCIEYGALVWHADKLDRDNEKKELCEKHGVQFIQIYAHSGEIEEDDIFDKNFIVYRVNYSEQEYQLKYITEHILNQFNYSIEEIDFEKACKDAFNFMHSADETTDGES